MELQLFRHDIVQTYTCAKGTMAVLPMSEEKKTQKVALGDLTGVVQCFSVKKSEISTAFKTLPAPSQKITSVSLGRGRQQRDRIFVAAGNTIKGISKKGKEFFKFNTQITETIQKVDVQDKNIWTSAEYVHNHFIEGRDKAFYLCPDRINAAEVVTLISKDDWSPVLACQDRHIRVISGKDVFFETATSAAPISLKFIPESHDPHHRAPNAKELLYGTENGTLVQLLMEGNEARQGFTLPNPKKLGAVHAIYSDLDLSKTGINDIVIGREDGSLEIYDMDEQGGLQQVYSAKLTESINSIDGGFVTSLNAQEIVMHMFSGKVVSYAPAGGGLLLPEGDKRLRGLTSETEERQAAYGAQIERLRADIDDLRGQIDKERNKFSEKGGNNALLAVSAPFTVNDRCKLEADEACYVLTVETSVPIFTVAIQCTIPLQLLDVPSNVAILSRSPPDPDNGSLTLATYRCQDATSRLSIKFKVREGEQGVLQAFIIPNISPKTCVSVTHKIKPLCLHQRLPSADVDRPTNELVITGTFGVSDMHGWVSRLLPDVPAAPADPTEVVYAFRNTLLDTQLVCRYRAGEARFTSDLITTLGIIQAMVTREATAAKHRVAASFQPSAAALQESIKHVWPQLERQRTLKRNFQLLEGLAELKMQDPDVGSYLSPEYKKILNDAEAIRAEYKEQPQHLDHLCSLIKDLYQDFCKLTSISAPKQRMPMLEQLLVDPRTTLDQVMDFMLGK